MKPVHVIVAIALSAGCGTLARGAEAASPAQSNHPEWAALYAITPELVEGAVYNKAMAAGLGGFEPVSPDLDKVIKAHLRPWALAKIEETNGPADDTGAICQVSGIFRYPASVGGFLWLTGAEKIVMVSTNINVAGVRRIYTNRDHPRNLPPTVLGDSVGRWEGNTLVVDTVGFNDKTWLYYGMEPHSEDLHVVERIRMAAAELMEIQTVVEDRQALTSPYTFTRYYKRKGAERPEHLCNAEPGEQREWSGWRKQALKAGFRPAGK
jgi:hypothetical protein